MSETKGFIYNYVWLKKILKTKNLTMQDFLLTNAGLIILICVLYPAKYSFMSTAPNIERLLGM